MGISDLIASFLKESLDEAEDGVVEVQRNDLAQRFNCVPSQINYVMSTRFSPERGYIVESRRGGNGYIRITRVQIDHQTLLMHVVGTGHPQQSGAVRCPGGDRGPFHFGRRGRQGTGGGPEGKPGHRSGGHSAECPDSPGIDCGNP